MGEHSVLLLVAKFREAMSEGTTPNSNACCWASQIAELEKQRAELTAEMEQMTAKEQEKAEKEAEVEVCRPVVSHSFAHG